MIPAWVERKQKKKEKKHVDIGSLETKSWGIYSYFISYYVGLLKHVTFSYITIYYNLNHW